MDARIFAIIDIGSNSGRLAVLRATAGGHLETIEEGRAALRLAADIDDDGNLSDAAFDRVKTALADFSAIVGAIEGVEPLVFATAAVREAPNQADFVARVEQETGLAIDVLSAEQEAHYSFLGAIRGLPADHGYALDIGGGSLEITHFRDRRSHGSRTLSLGALRLSRLFLKTDPPKPHEMRDLVEHARAALDDAGLVRLRDDEGLIGTGGTIRTLAKMDRRRSSYPLNRLHGYVVTREGIDRIVEEVSTVDQTVRSELPGLSEHRADSIVGGALAVQLVMEMLGATRLSVSGYGLREGIALARLGSAAGAIDEVRAASLAALVSRFAAWDAAKAVRRAGIATSVLAALSSDADEAFSQVIWNVAYLLDIGRAVDYFNRLSHTGSILQVADLNGFEHREIAMMTAIVRGIERKAPDLSSYAPLLNDADYASVELAAGILAISDELERRLPAGPPVVEIDTAGADVRIVVPGIQPERAGKLGHRLSKVLERTVSVV